MQPRHDAGSTAANSPSRARYTALARSVFSCLAAGLLEAFEGERSPDEIKWAAREFAETLGLATEQPVVLAFEDIHWAEEPLLDLIEYLADWVRSPVVLPYFLSASLEAPKDLSNFLNNS